MTAHRHTSSVDEKLVAGVLESGFFALRFPSRLEAYFEAETGLVRSHQLLTRGIAGIVFSLLYLGIDWLLTPDIFEGALWVRLGIVTPLSLLIVAILWRNPPPWLREGIVGAVCIVAVAATLTLMLESESPLRDGHQPSVMVIVLFLTMLQRLRFPYAVFSCGVIFAMYAYGLVAQTGYAPERMFTNISIIGCVIVLALIASYSLEHEVRLSYLLRLRERLRNIELASLSLHDALTGLNNRRSLDETLARLDLGEGHDETTAVLLIDVDSFKAYNDAFGHLAGDVCLKRVAGFIQSERRGDADMAFRFGGEEFLVLLPHTDLATAIAIAERIRRGIESAAIPHSARALPHVVTVSIGVAAARLGGIVTGHELISSADAALYAAKHAGRNQVWPRARTNAEVAVIDPVKRAAR